MNYHVWEEATKALLGGDPIWQVEGYRLALFLADIAWRDAERLLGERRTLQVADQLVSAVGSIGANIAEGYGRGPGKDRARFYGYALGSARESQTWYYVARHVLGDDVFHHRTALLASIVRLLTTMVSQQRGKRINDARALYVAVSRPHDSSTSLTDASAATWEYVPFSG